MKMERMISGCNGCRSMMCRSLQMSIRVEIKFSLLQQVQTCNQVSSAMGMCTLFMDPAIAIFLASAVYAMSLRKGFI